MTLDVVRRRPAVWVGSALLLAATVLPLQHAGAGATARWTVDSYEQWDEGEAESAFITSVGAVKPGWQTSRTELEVGGSWSAVRGSDGTFYLGSDDKATVWAVNGGKARKLASVPGAVAAVALALGPGNTLYAGTMPGGQIWRIDRGSGKASKVVDIKGVETVWSLAFDRGGRLFAGTGPDGKLFRVDPRSGSARMVFDTNDRRILAIIPTADGAVWFGTSDDALLFRHDPARGTTRAMADFAGNEITALAEHKGSIIAAANELKEPTTSGIKTSTAVKDAEGKATQGEKSKTAADGGKPGTEKATPSGVEPERKGERKGKGALYRVRGDGQLEQLHALTQTYFSSVAVTPSGQIFAGAGDKGRIYLIEADDSVSTAFDVTERQISQLLVEPGGKLAFVTGDGTALYRSTGRAGRATYTSKVFDAQAPARFGSLSWRSSGNVVVETRSGNTEEPGTGWSGWQRLRDGHPAGGGGQRGKVASPPGRYLQFRARLASDDAVLRQSLLYYLSQNRPTRLTGVTVGPGGEGGEKLKTMEAAAGTPRTPVLKLKWKVENEDGDETVYRLAVRREGDVRWRPIATGGKPLTATNFDWNTETYPDGYYQLRVMASDRRSNADDRALESQLTSAVFVVDNQKPNIGNVSVKYPSASARATDAISPIAEVAFSIDDGAWHLAGSQDGLLDDTTEILRLRLPDDLESGAHTLAIRVSDEAGNIGSAAVTFRVK